MSGRLNCYHPVCLSVFLSLHKFVKTLVLLIRYFTYPHSAKTPIDLRVKRSTVKVTVRVDYVFPQIYISIISHHSGNVPPIDLGVRRLKLSSITKEKPIGLEFIDSKVKVTGHDCLSLLPAPGPS